MPRRELDFYETPPHYIAALLGEVNITGRVYEPCVGEGAIADALRKLPAVRTVRTNDIDTKRTADVHTDARLDVGWVQSDWCITNPPFSDALEIIEQGLRYSQNCAFLGRLSFLEPTDDRETLLEQRPPTRVIVLPRYSFRLNDKGEKSSDSVTCCWMVWGNVVPGVSAWGRGKSKAYAVMQDLV